MTERYEPSTLDYVQAAVTLAREFPATPWEVVASALEEAGFDVFGSDDRVWPGSDAPTFAEWLDSARGQLDDGE